jgi:hypothetical protein
MSGAYAPTLPVEHRCRNPASQGSAHEGGTGGVEQDERRRLRRVTRFGGLRTGSFDRFHLGGSNPICYSESTNDNEKCPRPLVLLGAHPDVCDHDASEAAYRKLRDVHSRSVRTSIGNGNRPCALFEHRQGALQPALGTVRRRKDRVEDDRHSGFREEHRR